MRTSSERLQRVRGDIDELVEHSLPTEQFILQASDRLRSAVPFDHYCVRLCDPETSVPIAAVSDLDCETAPITYRHEYSGRDFATLPGMREDGTRVAVLSQATGGQPSRSGRWREVLEPMGVPHELTGLVTQNDRVWAHVMLYRDGSRADFDGREAEALGSVLRPLGEGIRSAFLGARARHAAASAVPDHPPTVIILDRANRITESTPIPTTWLAAISVPGKFASPLALQVLAVAARADRNRTALSRMHNPDGGWLTLHATAMGLPDPDRVAIVVQPTRGSEVAQLIFASLSLTPGEQSVVERVLQGLSTKEIAAALYISPHTVQDRLKSIFTKLGVRSRREVVALLEQRLAS
jgi:DNA-binding CsgD family transcriptional regulator